MKHQKNKRDIIQDKKVVVKDLEKNINFSTEKDFVIETIE